MQEHPNAAVVRRTYEARARGDTAALSNLVSDVACVGAESRTPLSISAVGDVAVVIDCARSGADIGVVVFRVVGGRVAHAQRLAP